MSRYINESDLVAISREGEMSVNDIYDRLLSETGLDMRIEQIEGEHYGQTKTDSAAKAVSRI